MRGGERQADQRAAEQRAELFAACSALRDEPERHRRDDAGDDHALVERVHDLAAVADAHEEGADDRGDDRGGAERQRIDQRRRCRACVQQQPAEQHGGDDRDRVGLEQVRGHAGAVADVVADVVGDHGGVARVILGNAGFDLADEVGADVGALGEDAAAEAREDRDQRAAEGQADQRVQRRRRRRARRAAARSSR